MRTGRALIATIAGFAALGFAILALIYWAITLGFGPLDLALQIMLIVAIVSFSIYLLAAPESVGQAAGRRSNKLTANALVASAVAIGIAIAVNIIAESTATVRADWTAGKTFTLSPQTVEVLQNLKSEVRAIAFYSPQNPGANSREQIEDLLREYATKSDKFNYEFVDPIQSPTRAQQFTRGRLDVQFGSVLFDNGQRAEVANNVAEADFTGAILRLQQNVTPTVAFLTGHGERDPNGFEQDGYSQVKQALERENYRMLTWNLTVTPTLTLSDVTVLIIAEPKRPLQPRELQAVQSYLDSGGRVLLTLDTLMPTEALAPLQAILDKYGIDAVQGGLVDKQNSISMQDETIVRYNTYPSDHEITRDLQRQQLEVIFPLAMGLRPPTSTLQGLQATSIVQSSFGEQASWLETAITPNITGTIELNYTPNQDLPGPVSIALTLGPAAIGATTSPTDTNTVTNTVLPRMVVFGDADFPSNFWLSQVPVNLDLFANSVSWLAGANDLVSIRAKDPETPRRIILNEAQQRLVLFSSVIGLPVLVLLTGAFMWWRRR